jgi:hypothetical protein
MPLRPGGSRSTKPSNIVISDQSSSLSNLVTRAELAKGHTITVVRSHSMLVTDTPADKYNLTIGECSGTLVTADGTTTGSGHCARRDKSGDSYSTEWAIAPGSERGTWKAVAGTGKFSRRTGSGWWQNATRDGKMFASRWGGTCN